MTKCDKRIVLHMISSKNNTFKLTSGCRLWSDIFFLSPLHTICRCLQTQKKPLFHKKIEFMKHDKNMSTHYSSSTAIFVKTTNIPYYSKKVLCACQETTYFDEQNAHISWWITLYILLAVHTSFVISSVFVFCEYCVAGFRVNKNYQMW